MILENQFAHAYTSFSSRLRFNEGRTLWNKPAAYFNEGARLPRQRGNFYYGARYVVYPERSLGDPKISVWLSVDPLASNYPYISPYNFVENNPLMLIDPTGMGPEGAEGGPGTHTIVPDDTYYGLATRTYKDDPSVTVENLRLWNPGVDENDLQLDQVINISDPKQSTDRNQETNSDQQVNSSQAQDNNSAVNSSLAVSGSLLGTMSESYSNTITDTRYGQRAKTGKVNSANSISNSNKVHSSRMSRGFKIGGKHLLGLQ